MPCFSGSGGMMQVGCSHARPFRNWSNSEYRRRTAVFCFRSRQPAATRAISGCLLAAA